MLQRNEYTEQFSPSLKLVYFGGEVETRLQMKISFCASNIMT